MYKRITNLLIKVKEDKALLKKIVLTSITRGISAIGTFVFNFSLARFLGVSDFGNFMLLYSIVVGLGYLIRYGSTTAIIRFASILFENKQFNYLRQLQKRVFKSSFITSIVIVFLICVMSPFFAHILFGQESYYKILVVFSFSLPFYAYLTTQSSYLKAYKKPELAPFIEVGLSAFVTGLLVALLAFLGFITDIYIAAICFLIANVIIYFSGSYVLNKVISKEKVALKLNDDDDDGVYDFKLYNESLFDYFTTSITTYLFKFSPTLILGVFASSVDVGLYSLANSSAFVINFILWIFSTVYAPHFSILYESGKIKELSKMLKKSIIYMSIVAVPIFLIIVIFPEYILGIFGKDYTQAKNGLIIMACAQLFNVLTGPVYFLLNMTGHQRKLRSIVLGTAVISVVCSFVLIPYFGYMGAVISTSLGLVLQNAFSFYHSKKLLGIKLL